jgi:cytochrome c-type biogenesis protein CcmE
VIALALGYLLFRVTQSNTQYFMTVQELQTRQSELQGQKLRMSGAVIGETIEYNSETLDLSFTVAQIPGDHRLIAEMGGMAKTLAEAVADPNAARMTIHYNGVRPDLLKDEAQAIMTGSLDENGVFQATQLMLKCPSKYESALPEQAED